MAVVSIKQLKDLKPGDSFVHRGKDYYVGARGNAGEQTIFLMEQGRIINGALEKPPCNPTQPVPVTTSA